MSILYKLPESSNLKVGDRVDFCGNPTRPVRWYHKVYDAVYYSCFSRFRWSDRVYTAKQFLQKHFKGVTDAECFDFYRYHAEYCIVRLKRLKEYGNSHPPNFVTIEAWHTTIDEMIWAFEFSQKEPYDYMDEDISINEYIVTSIVDGEATITLSNEDLFKKASDIAFEKYQQDRKRFLKAMQLFGQYYNSLWD